VTLVLGGTEEEAEATLTRLRNSRDLFDEATHKAWNDYLWSVPLVAPAEPFDLSRTTGEERTIIRRSSFAASCGRGEACSPNPLRSLSEGQSLVIADWLNFVGMWGNDGIAKLSLLRHGPKGFSACFHPKWFRYKRDAAGDGTLPWTIFPSGRNTFGKR